MLCGRTPFEHIKNKMKKWLAISDPSVTIQFPTDGCVTDSIATSIMKVCVKSLL